jgi:sodium-dependent dicarboxylate transporter 2/3/5
MTTPPVPIAHPPLLARAGRLVGPLLALMVYFLPLDGLPEPARRVATLAALMATFWLTEAIPLAATALLPLVALPLLGVGAASAVAGSYANEIIFLFLGGFLVAIAMEACDLHRRLALRLLLVIGTRPRALLAGFLFSTAFVSMWISNTATAMMMVPIAMALLARLGESVGRLGPALMLAIAYGASIGGVATLVGTPPNLVFVQLLARTFPEAPPISFASWLAFGAPFALALLAGTWLWLSWWYQVGRMETGAAGDVIRAQHRGLGRMTRDQIIVGAVFGTLALLWITRQGIDLGGVALPGWSALFPEPKFIGDGTVAMAAAALLFLVPSIRGGCLLGQKSFAKVPWDIVLLFGGGFALADAFVASGLSLWLGGRLELLRGINPLLLMILVCIGVTFATELTSNTATAQVILPILAVNAVAVGMDPRLLMIAGTISSSMAFMLPVATPPNAIVFASGRLSTLEMARAGFVMNLVGVVLIPVVLWLVGGWAFGIEYGTLPEWARLPPSAN